MAILRAIRVTQVLDMIGPLAGFVARPRTLRKQKDLSRIELRRFVGLRATRLRTLAR